MRITTHLLSVARWAALVIILASFSWATATAQVAKNGANIAPKTLKLLFGDHEYTSEINMCHLMGNTVAVAGESDSEPERIKVMFRTMGGKSVFTVELIYVLDGVKRRENWEAEGEMITGSSIDGKLITAEGKIQRKRVRTMVNGLWEEHSDSGSEAYESFSLMVRCK